MKNKRRLIIVAGLLICMVVNSCKKSGLNPLQKLFTGGSWQLASILQFNFTGNQLISTDTLNLTCNMIQAFTFNTNNTCTYTNFDCITQTTQPGTWALSSDQLHLQAQVVCKDTSAAGSSMPFANAAILNLGDYSLVLLTGDIAPNYSLTLPRHQIQYGFVRVKTGTSN